ncbi:MAG: hypothetical protein R3C56_29500 [Pirellulaceae bacterium]
MPKVRRHATQWRQDRSHLTGGFAFYLPGVGSGSGIGSGERLTAAAFSRDPVINRAIHFAGGSMTAEISQPSDHYTLAAWIWLGEPSGARNQRSGLIVRGPFGEKLIARIKIASIAYDWS